ncbi:DNA-binding protein RFX5 isoform X1 [Pelobates fuscus]|uniref:DNA-binding protein RFX5 isoform X1 n=1 Tax=Pelobates fuscus TaxID=191477 RepID=UPI002FE47DCD
MAEGALFEKTSKKGTLTSGESPGDLVQKLRTKITKSVQCKVDSILLDVQKLTDNDKLYLYLQLPPGPSAPEKSSLDISSVSTAEHMYACTWIRNHLEEHTDTCLPKQDVYNAYKRYCDNLCGRPLSVANFGKIIREIFPNIKARRLGGRGQSKYCYSGLRRKSMVSMPPLPSLDLKMAESSELTDLVQSYNNDVINASCSLICNWAEKILKRSFNNVVEVAQFLIQQHIINPRSANAELVLSMVLSDSSQSGGQKTVKQNMDVSGSKAPASPESGTDTSAKNKKVTNTLPGSPQQVKKRPPETQKVVNSPQVDALVARLPVLLPRLASEEKFLNASPSIRFNPPVLAPNILPAPLKVSPLPFTAVPSGVPLTVTAGMNGTGLVSQPVAPQVISMIIPDRVSLEAHSLPKSTQNGGTKDTTVLGSGETRGTKRQSVSSAVGGGEGLSKRKRGRPRKVDVSYKPSTQAPLNTDRIVGETASSAQTKDANKDTVCCPVTQAANAIPFAQEKLNEALHSAAQKELKDNSEMPPKVPATVKPTEQQDELSAIDIRNPGDAAPIQVSVIQDGRVAHWTVKRELIEKNQEVTLEESSTDIRKGNLEPLEDKAEQL